MLSWIKNRETKVLYGLNSALKRNLDYSSYSVQMSKKVFIRFNFEYPLIQKNTEAIIEMLE